MRASSYVRSVATLRPVGTRTAVSAKAVPARAGELAAVDRVDVLLVGPELAARLRHA